MGLAMNMTGRALHEYLETKIDNFKDPDLYNDATVFQVDDDVIESQIEQGCLSINNRQGPGGLLLRTGKMKTD